MGRTNATAAAVAELRPLADTETGPIVMLTRAQLRQLVQEAVFAALEEHKAGERPEQATLSGVELAKRLGLSRNAITRLRQEGMPSLQLGDIHRYELAPCLAWLRERGREAGGP